MKQFIISLSILLVAAGCAQMSTTTSSSLLSGLSKVKSGGLTNEEVVAGLKEALTIGVQKGVQQLAAENGYYNDLATRIGLPEEALVITENISKLPGGQALVDNAIKRINAAASDAASQAAPIFVAAIKNMTIKDAMKILSGGNNAATEYFKSATKSDLKKLYASYIDESLDKKLVGNVSASSSWNTLTSKWNSVAGTVVGKAAGLTTVNTDLTDYLTDQAVDGMYKKIAEQEAEIRTKASARTTALLKKVFGR